MEANKNPAASARVTDPPASREIGENLLAGVVWAAVVKEGQRPGVWQRMICALNQGAAKTEDGTVDAFLFQAMVDRLLEEFRTEGQAKG